MMQRIFLAGLVFILMAAGSAQAFDNPKALLEAIYAPYIAGAKPTPVETFYSARLKGLYAANLQRQSVDGTGAAVDPAAPQPLAFDPFIEGQNALLLDLVVNPPTITGDRAMATVSFHNFDHTALLAFSMVREAGDWKIDDIASLSGENWLLSWLLQYDPFGVM